MATCQLMAAIDRSPPPPPPPPHSGAPFILPPPPPYRAACFVQAALFVVSLSPSCYHRQIDPQHRQSQRPQGRDPVAPTSETIDIGCPLRQHSLQGIIEDEALAG